VDRPKRCRFERTEADPEVFDLVVDDDVDQNLDGDVDVDSLVDLAP
jgi:hypothetical protein